MELIVIDLFLSVWVSFEVQNGQIFGLAQKLRNVSCSNRQLCLAHDWPIYIPPKSKPCREK